MTVSAMRAPAAAEDDLPDIAAEPHLSTDYLNRYGEALMLIEMAPMDFDILDDLKDWRVVDYRGHFEASQLRCAASALQAYEALDPARRQAFEELCRAMSRLIATVTALLGDLRDEREAPVVVEVASEALRSLIGRATRFINANGQIDLGGISARGLQSEIDGLFGR
ncbi:hypothetical protein SAMN05216304_10349 [Bosea sp. OK403]|uniref:hypothetical protein n=1 Tax=Bosea sp. OK403 TaxID=1855286 RepID=UPI0008EE014C|nr:hypothetical protein [Bosea sp. OK403]SFI65326.1 hypothetical protein SAMN05216304_10349 [Bosea sp. OK403]